MRRRISLVDPANPGSSPTHLTITGDETLPITDVVAALSAHNPMGTKLFLGSSLLPEDGEFGDSPLIDGDRIGLGGPIQPARVDRRWSTYELRLVGGPEAGKVFPLPSGRHVVGRQGSTVAVGTDDLMSRSHLQLDVGSELSVTDLGSANGTFVEGRRLDADETATLDGGEFIQAGATLLQIVPAAEPDHRLQPQPDGRRGLNRKFRSGEEALPDEVAFPTKPTPGDRPGMNLAMTIAPAALFGALVVFGLLPPTMLMFMAMGPIMGVGSAVTRRKQHAKKTVRDHETYVEETETARQDILAARSEEAAQLRRAHPDPAAIVQCARAAERLLWARHTTDPDLLELRVGAGNRRSRIRASSAATDDPDLWRCPIVVSLPAVGGVGITGGDLGTRRGLARSLVLQAATLHSPAEVRIMVLTTDDDEAERSWSWVRWLPHARWSADEDFSLIGSDKKSTSYRLEELKDLVARRLEQLGDRNVVMAPAIVVVYDGVDRLTQLGFAEILRDGPRVAIYAVTIDEVQVPEGCNSAVELGREGDDAIVEVQGQPTRRNVLTDNLGLEPCDLAARCLAPLRLIGESGVDELPGNLHLLEMMGMPDPDSNAVQELWKRFTRTPGAPVGLTTSGELILDMTRDGPHGIIAGASRSGKSEFLKTFIAALAAWNHPDDLCFIFIDFKGGNDYQVAKTLPHTVDLATQIDQAGFERSLALLDAEIVRRTQIAGQLQTSTLEGYWAAQAKMPLGASPTIGRLIVIVDEFAELAQKNPEQLDRLVSVARVGAAMGVHLILATQRPGGVVSGQIDANSPLRVSFRTVAKEHSSDVIGSPVAAEIAERHRGRGYKRAHAEPPIEFQCARVGNARVGLTSMVNQAETTLDAWDSIGHLPPPDKVLGEVPDPDTDFYALADAIRKAALETGWTRNAVPWPKPLPDVISVDDLPPDGVVDDAARALRVPFAVVDDPQQQAHLPAPVVLGAGPVAIAGSNGTGRTTAVRVLAASAATAHAADRLHIYALDMHGSGVAGLAQLPHVGGVSLADAEMTSRILERLESIVRERRPIFERVGASSLVEYNAGDHPTVLPWLLFLIDGWEVIHEEGQSAAGQQVYERIVRLIKDGASVGIQTLIAGDRTVCTGAVNRVIAHRYVLRFNAEVDYDTCGINSRLVPDQMEPGRALAPDGRSYQIATLGDGTGGGQAAVLRSMAETLREQTADLDPASLPRRIRSLPPVISYAELLAEAPTPTEMAVPLLVGFEAETAAPRWIDAAVDSPAMMIAGRRRSGRSSALVALGMSAISAGVDVVLLIPKPSPLDRLVGAPGVVASYVGREAASAAELHEVATSSRVLILIDDADTLDPMHNALLQIVGAVHPAKVVVAAAGTEAAKGSMGFMNHIRKSRSGFVFCPESQFDGQAIGARNLPRQLQFDQPQGRAVLSVDGEVSVVQMGEISAD